MREVKIFLSEATDERLRAHIRDKNTGFKRGLLSHTVEQAIKFYLENDNTHAHTQQIQKNHGSQTLPIYSKQASTKYEILKQELKHYANQETGKIDESIIKSLIKKHIGRDKRTQDKYLLELENENIIYLNNADFHVYLQPWFFETVETTDKVQTIPQTK